MSTSKKDGTFCIMVQQLNLISKLNLIRKGVMKIKNIKKYVKKLIKLNPKPSEHNVKRMRE